jgi:hypothetical protein
MLVHSKIRVDMDNNETSAMASIPDQLIRAYAQGAIAWRDIVPGAIFPVMWLSKESGL